MIEHVVRPVVDRDALRRQPVPGVEVEGEERCHRRAGGLREIVPADLAVIVREPFRKRLRRREQQQPRVLVGVGRQQHDLGRLKKLLASGDVGDTSHAALVVDVDARHVRPLDDREPAGLLGARNGRHVGTVLRVDMTAAPVAEAVVHARRAILKTLRIDGGWPGERMPAQLARGRRHAVEESGAAQWRHRIVTRAGGLENIAPGIQRAKHIAHLAGHADFPLDAVVVGLEFVVAERPVLDRRSGGNAPAAIAAHGVADGAEVEVRQTPALGPVVQGRAAHAIHHHVSGGAGRRCRRVDPVRRHFVVALLDGHGPVAHVVADFIRGKVTVGQPRTSLEPHDVESGFSQRQYGDAARGTKANDDDICARQVSRHLGHSRQASPARWPC